MVNYLLLCINIKIYVELVVQSGGIWACIGMITDDRS